MIKRFLIALILVLLVIEISPVRATITPANLTNGFDASDLSSYATASITPTSDALILPCIVLLDSTSPVTPTVTGNSITYDFIARADHDTGGQQASAFLFRGLDASPTAGVITINPGAAHEGALWSITEFAGVDTSGINGAGAIEQSATNTGSIASSSTLTVTLASFADAANNVAAGCFGMDEANTGDIGPGSGFTVGGDVANTADDDSLLDEYKTGEDTSVDAVNGASGTQLMGGIAVEIDDGAAAAPRRIFIFWPF